MHRRLWLFKMCCWPQSKVGACPFFFTRRKHSCFVFYEMFDSVRVRYSNRSRNIKSKEFSYQSRIDKYRNDDRPIGSFKFRSSWVSSPMRWQCQRFVCPISGALLGIGTRPWASWRGSQTAMTKIWKGIASLGTFAIRHISDESKLWLSNYSGAVTIK